MLQKQSLKYFVFIGFSACGRGWALVKPSPSSAALLTRSNRIRTINNDMAAKPLTKSQTAAAVAEANGLTKKQATDLLTNLADLAISSTKKTGAFTFPGVGKLKLVNRKARMGRNPATGEEIKIPAKTVVKFTVAKAAKDAIAG